MPNTRPRRALQRNNHRAYRVLGLVFLLSGVPTFQHARCEEPPENKSTRVSIQDARHRATLLQQVYLSTQDVLHRRYFHGGKTTVPARAMEEVFADIEQQTGSKANWISVTLEPMSIDHQPKSKFEKRASAALKSGKESFESLEDGYYRRAVSVPLSGGCIHCHAGLVSRPPAKPVAGLVVSIPVESNPLSDPNPPQSN